MTLARPLVRANVRELVSTLVGAGTEIIPTTPWSPLDEDSLGDWWKFNDLTNSAVSSWLSRKTTFPQTLVQATSGLRPVRSAAGVAFDGVDDKLASTPPIPTYVKTTAMPDIVGHSYDPGHGFSNGGICRDPTDGSWWVTNGGRTPFAAESTRRPALINLAADVNGSVTDTVLHVVDLYTLCAGNGSDTASGNSKIAPWGLSVQDDGTVWTGYGNGVDPARLEQIVDPKGTPSRGHSYVLTADVRSITGYNSLGAIWVYDFTDQRLRLVQCSDGTILQTVVYFAGALGDHIHYIEADKIMMYFSGGNAGPPGTIGLRNMRNNVDFFTMDMPELYGGIEQGYYDSTRKKLYINSNAWLHQVPVGPMVNRVLEWDMPTWWAHSITIFAVFKVPTIGGTRDFLFGTDYISRPGFSVAVTNTGVTNLSLHQHSGPIETAVERIVADFTVPNVQSAYRMLVATFKPGVGISLRMDGTFIRTETDALTGGVLKNVPMRISQGNTDSECSTEIIKEFGYYNDDITLDVIERTEGEMAHSNDLASNLPADHTYKINVDATIPGAFTISQWSVANARTGNKINITLADFPANGGSPLLGVDYQLNGGSWVNLVTVPLDTPIPATVYAVTGLTNDQLYSVKLRAFNTIGAGPGSDTKTVTPDLSVPTIAITTGSGYVGSIYSSTFNGVPHAAQWTADGVNISGETGTTYQKTAAAEGKAIQQDGSNAIEMWVPSDMGSILIAHMDAYRGITLNGSDVSQWDDQKNGYAAVQATGGQQPLYDATNSVMGSRPAVVLTAANSDRMTLASSGSNQTQPYVQAAVAYTASLGAQRMILEGQANGNRGALLISAANKLGVYAGNAVIESTGTITVNRPFIGIGRLDGANSFARLNGVQGASGNAGTQVSRLGTIGSTSLSANFWNGGISEGIRMADAAAFYEFIEGYFAHRYGGTLLSDLAVGHTYKTNPPRIQ